MLAIYKLKADKILLETDFLAEKSVYQTRPSRLDWR